MHSQEHQQRIIRRKRFFEITSIPRSTMYDRLNPKSPRYDPDFPRPIKIGTSAIGWIEAEVYAYVELLMSRSRKEV